MVAPSANSGSAPVSGYSATMRNSAAPKRVLIIGGAGWNNVGDDLIAAALREWMESYGCRVTVVGGPYPHSEASPNNAALDGRTISKLRLLAAIAQADYVLIGGGGLLDDRTANFYRPFTRTAAVCRALRTPYAFVGIGVGPIQQHSSKKEYLRSVQGAAKVYVRDEESKERLRDCGVTRNIAVVSDPVLWADGHGSVQHLEYDLAVNLRNWHSSQQPRTGFEGPEDRVVVELVAKAINDTLPPDAKVALVSMSSHNGDDDSLILDDLRSRLKPKTYRIYGGAESVERVVNKSESVLAMRLHTCLLGVRSKARVIGLAYDPKVSQQGQKLGFPVINLDTDFSTRGYKQLVDGLQTASPSQSPAVAPGAPWGN